VIDKVAANSMTLSEKFRRVAIFASGAIAVIALVMAVKNGADFFVTADQRGQWLMDRQDYQQAAETFSDPLRQGSAYYRAGDFKSAASVFAGLPGQEAAFNHGNSLVMLGKYQDAINSYDQALELRPDWQAAKTNREIARGRAERLDFEGGDMTGGKLGADEIVFDLKKNSPNAGEEVVEGGAELSDEELRAMWLRQVQTTPGDFLRAKFAYQQAMRQADAGDQNE
jgi:Ca-activated chloride channel family protein